MLQPFPLAQVGRCHRLLPLRWKFTSGFSDCIRQCSAELLEKQYGTKTLLKYPDKKITREECRSIQNCRAALREDKQRQRREGKSPESWDGPEGRNSSAL